MTQTETNLGNVLRRLARGVPDSLQWRGRKRIIEETSVAVDKLVRPWDEDVADFHLKFGHPVSTRAAILDRDVMRFRIKLIWEECNELCDAIEARDLAAIAHEAVDLVYVVLGTLVSCGLRFTPFWNLVHRANMAKEVNPDGGKPLKPEGWVKPDCASLITEDVQDLDPLATERGYN